MLHCVISEPKLNKANGHSSTSERYSTRCATGVIQRKRYDRILSDDDENVDDSLMYRGSRQTAHHHSDSDDEDDDRRPGKAIASKRQVKSSKPPNRSETNVDSPSKSSSESENSSSESATEAATDSELTDAYSDDDRPSVSAAKTNLRMRSAGGRVANGRHRGREESDYEYDDGRMYRTRNRGRQTVHYNEESDGERGVYNRSRKQVR